MASYRTRRILAELLTDDPPGTGADLPNRLVAWCSRSLPVTGVGLVLMVHGQPAGTVAATDGVATGLEDLQFTVGEGPCVDSATTGRPVLVADLAAAQGRRWPTFTAGALDLGARAVFALPLRVGAIRLGVLDLYRDTPGPLVDGDLAEALSFADAATDLLLHLQEHAPDLGDHGDLGDLGDPGDPDRLPPPLGAEDRRAEVHQATGMVAVQTGLALSAALVLLRARAYSLSRPVLEVARDVLGGLLDFSRPGP